jgi:hypothetical protein
LGERTMPGRWTGLVLAKYSLPAWSANDQKSTA